MRWTRSGIQAAMAAGVLISAIGCSSDGDDRHSDNRNRGSSRDQRERIDRAQGDYADRDRDGIRDGLEDRNRDGVRDGNQNNGTGIGRTGGGDPDRYR